MQIEKPLIFISHATTDEPIVSILKAEIDRVFANGVSVFASSIDGSIKPGSNWLDTIEQKLEQAKVIIVLITPVSINRPWIWFEVGASWSKMIAGNRRIYPLCVPEVEFNQLPPPLNLLQALSLGKAEHIKQLFETLCQEFGFGNIKGFKGSTIKSRLPKYEQLEVSEVDLQSGTIYSGPYEGYSDDELKEILYDEFVKPDLNSVSYSDIRKGKLLHYRKIDKNLNLPPGTSKKYLIEVVARYEQNSSFYWSTYEPKQEFENSIRFKELTHEYEDVDYEDDKEDDA